MARSAGFRIAGLFGSYDRAPFDPVRSPVMIWELEKEGLSPGGQAVSYIYSHPYI
jgi:hypothetical protein